MEQTQIVCGSETSPAKLSWLDMVDLNIEIDYEANIFSIKEDNDSTSKLHPIKPENGTEIKLESFPSGEFNIPSTVEVEQEPSPSAGCELPPTVEVDQELYPFVDSRPPKSNEIQQEFEPSKRSEKTKKQHLQGHCQQAELAHLQAPVYYVASNSQDPKRKSMNPRATGNSKRHHLKYCRSDKMPHHASAVTVICPSMNVEQVIKDINDLTQQVDDLKKELQGKIFDLHEERERRIEFQVECKAQLEQIQELEKSLEHERHMRVKCEKKEEQQETFAAPPTTGVSKFPRIPKVTVNISVLNEFQFLKRQAEKNALHTEKLAKALVEEQQLRVKYENQLKSNLEQTSKYKEQEEIIQFLKSQVAELTAELNIAAKKEHHKGSSQKEKSTQTNVSSQTETSTQTDVSNHTEVPSQTKVSNQRETQRHTGNHRNRGVHAVRNPQHDYRRDNSSRGPNAHPGPQRHAGHRPNPGLYSYTGHHLNPGLYTHTGYHPNAGHYPNAGHRPNGGHQLNPGLYVHLGQHPNIGFHAKMRYPPYRGQ